MSDIDNSGNESDSGSSFASTSFIPPEASPGPKLILAGGRVRQLSEDTSAGRTKKWICDFEGCGKAYTRPVRLDEHRRSHTGERPFSCAVCGASFTRDSHLKAHERTHQNDDDKPHACDECDKRFWTNQHLRKHVEVIHRGKTYNCEECESSFRKHHQLRTHIAEAHSPPGTNPFQCDFPGCDKSFKQKVHLSSHVKTHDPTRYQCAHPDCASLPPVERQFTNWTALQQHTKIKHPPKCPYDECKGKTFSTGRGLKAHLAIHRAKEGPDNDVKPVETDGGYTTDGKGKGSKKRRGRGRARKRAAAAEAGTESEQDRRETKRARVAPVEVDLPWKCEAQVGCTKAFDSREALLRHVARQHSKKSDVAPPPPSLAEFMAAAPSPDLTIAPLPSGVSAIESEPTAAQLVAISSDSERNAYGSHSLLGLLTGHDYAGPTLPPTRSHSHSASGTPPRGFGDNRDLPRKFRCPYPAILEIAELAARSETENESEELDNLGRDCAWRFKRAYDVERHLKSRHGCRVNAEQLEEWLEEQVEQEEEEMARA